MLQNESFKMNSLNGNNRKTRVRERRKEKLTKSEWEKKIVSMCYAKVTEKTNAEFSHVAWIWVCVYISLSFSIYFFYSILYELKKKKKTTNGMVSHSI